MKNTFKKLLQGIALISATATLPTVQAFDTRLLDEVRKLKIEKLVDIPIQSLKAVESNGEIHYISNNGRFILQGRLVDVLQQKPLDTMPQIAFATQKLTIRDLSLDIGTLNSITIETGETRIFAYVDPLCDSCIRLMKEAQKISDKYTFHFLVLPALGNASHELAKRVSCAADKNSLFDAFINKKLGSVMLEPTCDLAGYDLTL